MSSILGLNLKKFKQFTGREGYGFNADLYLGNKKIASCYDAGNGGQIDVNWVVDTTKEEINNIHDKVDVYFAKYPKWISEHQNMFHEFIEELITLTELEKQYKKWCKQGFETLVKLSFHDNMTPLNQVSYDKLEDKVLGFSVWDEEKEKEMIEKHTPVIYKVYERLADFIIE